MKIPNSEAIAVSPVYKHLVIDALQHCIGNKGLEANAWVLMSNHMHLVASATDANTTLSDMLRDVKKFTSKKIVATITEVPESRRDWMLYRFDFAGKYDRKIKNNKFWQDGNDAEEIQTFPFLKQKRVHT